MGSNRGVEKLTAAGRPWCLEEMPAVAPRGYLVALVASALCAPASADRPAAGGGAPLAAVSAGGDTRLARAEPRRRAKKKRWDYSRFSNGPRRVPRARGASLARAEALGIGGLKATKKLLRAPAPRALLEAVPGERPRTLLWPVVGGRWGRGFGFVRRVRTDLRHNGIDVAAPAGAVVRAAADGLVVYSDNTLRGLGNAVVILHPGGWTTLYAHNARNTVQPGWRVKRGERIGLVGATGIARGPHLHFEWRDNGRLGDPKRLFVGRKSDELAGPLVALDGEARAPESETVPETESEAEAETVPAAATVSEAATESATVPATETALPFELGTVATARRLMTRPAPALPESVVGRRFSNLLWPVKGGYLSRGHGAGGHRGVDIAAEEGSGVRAAADGIVVYSGDGLAGMGHAVVLLHRTGWVTIYAGNRENGVEAGDQVQRGQWIGRVGRSAAGSEPHLHFEWLQAGEHRDPSPLLTAPAAP